MQESDLGLQVASQTLQIYGVCDVVEFIQNENGISLSGLKGTYTVVPIEYKKGSGHVAPHTRSVDCKRFGLLIKY